MATTSQLIAFAIVLGFVNWLRSTLRSPLKKQVEATEEATRLILRRPRAGRSERRYIDSRLHDLTRKYPDVVRACEEEMAAIDRIAEQTNTRDG